MNSPARLFVIDAMALAYRSYFALGRSSLSASGGVPTGAIYGAAMFMNKLLTSEQPAYLLSVTDTPEPTFRHELYTDYKAHRQPMPDDLSTQIPLIFELLLCYGCPLLKIPGVEADDVIASAATAFAGQDLSVYIVSGDKDFMQLINDHVLMYAPKKKRRSTNHRRPSCQG